MNAITINPAFADHVSGAHWTSLLSHRDCVLIIGDDYVAYRGYSGPMPREGGVTLIPDAEGRYNPVIGNRCDSVDRIDVAFAQLSVEIFTGPAMPYPCFWSTSRGILVVGRSARWVSDVLQVLKEPAELDLMMASVSFCMDALVGGRTYYRGIVQTRMGEQLVFSPSFADPKRRITWKPVYDAEELARLSLREASARICERLEDLPLPKGPVLVALSGGLDSRMLACLLKRAGTEFTCYTFQRGTSFESAYAQQVARALGVKHTVIDLPVECYGEFGIRVALESGGMVTPMHSHMAWCMKVLSEEMTALPHVIGYFGDPIMGSFQKGKEAAEDLDEVIEYTVRSMLRDSRLLTPQAQIFFRQTLMNEFERYAVPSTRLLETLKLVVRQQGLITHIFSYLEKYGPVYRPYVNGPLIDLCTALPRPVRQNRMAFYEAGRMMFPEVLALPTGYRSSRRLPAKWERLKRRWEQVKHFSTWAVLGARRALPHRNSGENHDVLLAGELRERVVESSRIVQEALSLTFRMPCLNLLNRGHGYVRTSFGKVAGPFGILPQEMFRTLTIAALLRAERSGSTVMTDKSLS